MSESGEMSVPVNQYDTLSAANQLGLYLALSEPYVKIGLSRSPVDRLIKLREANPHKIRMVAAWWVPLATAARAEAYCHQRFLHAWHRSEWFSVGVKEARSVVKSVAAAACASRGRALRGAPLPLAADLERRLQLRSKAPHSRRVLANSMGGHPQATDEETANELMLRTFTPNRRFF